MTASSDVPGPSWVDRVKEGSRKFSTSLHELLGDELLLGTDFRVNLVSEIIALHAQSKDFATDVQNLLKDKLPTYMASDFQAELVNKITQLHETFLDRPR